MDGARRRHYKDFYAAPPADGPLLLVVGNCQAESLRVLLAGSPTLPYRTVRMPPVHELDAADLPWLDGHVRVAAALVAQPVRDDYRDLPIGTAQLIERLPGGARVVRWPVIRYHGLFPFSAIVRHDRDRAAVPDLIPYHDLRTLAEVAGLGWQPSRHPESFRAVAAESMTMLTDRERRHRVDVTVSDLLVPAGAAAMATLNHPGNAVLIGLARRVQHVLGVTADAADPGRTLLDAVHAPIESDVLAALGIAGDPRPHWIVDGRDVSVDEVLDAHRRWYAAHPEWVEAGIAAHATRLSLLSTAD